MSGNPLARVGGMSLESGRPFPADLPSITAILQRADGRIRETLTALWPLVYDDLRRMAARRLRNAPADSLPPTGLVHELFIRLVGAETVKVVDRTHFFSLASRAMRAILVDRGRARQALKRPSAKSAVPIDLDRLEAPRTVDVLEIDALLGRLAATDAELAQIVELRVFGGLSLDDVGEVMGMSIGTVKRRWRLARAWLVNELRAATGRTTQ